MSTEVKDIILGSLQQSQGFLAKALDDLTQEEASWRPTSECNSIAFILWHLARVEDYFMSRVIQRQTETYEAEGWQQKLGTAPRDMGFGYTVEKLQAWPVPKLEIIRGYHEAVRLKTLAFLESATPEKLAEVPRPDRSPDSIGISLGHMATELALHISQIAYLRGVKRGLDK